jgi:hypothetical protein
MVGAQAADCKFSHMPGCACAFTCLLMPFRRFVYEAVGNDTRTREVNGIKGLKVSPGLSEFGLTPHDVVPYMIPLFEHAAQLIPPEHHSSARVYIKATAGMRLLPKEQRVAVYDALCDGLCKLNLPCARACSLMCVQRSERFTNSFPNTSAKCRNNHWRLRSVLCRTLCELYWWANGRVAELHT